MSLILDWNEYRSTARQAVAEGCVLLENNGALPLDKSEQTAVFGRIAEHYYKSGTGSGGMVNVTRVWSIMDGLLDAGISVNEELRGVYAEWEKDNPIDTGEGWGTEPWSQKEMPVSDELCARIAQQCPAAVCIIGRTAGEEQDATESEGSYLLTETEREMLRTVRRHFGKMTVLLNVGSIIDMSFVDEIKPDAVMYVWQGGMEGGLGTADVLTGKVSPCGKLTDTIAKSVASYPSAGCFGDRVRNFYREDIYVGYRYFETFDEGSVRYPFGYGKSYTTFETECVNAFEQDGKITLDVRVKNTGSFSGKEVVQAYFSAPQGCLGKPLRQLCAYAKTAALAPNEEQILRLEFPVDSMASYDDSGATGWKSCFIMEAGCYIISVGTDVRRAKACFTYQLDEAVLTARLSEALAPVLPFERIHPTVRDGELVPDKEAAPTATVDTEQRRLDRLPPEIPYTGDCGIKLADVRAGRNTMDDFIAQISDADLACIVRGEGMGSPRVTAGTASAFGGVSDRLTSLGIPCGCCGDGPSGMRLDCGTKAFSLPNGTMLACTFNTELVEQLYALAGIEVASNNIECLLGPGINIHRHPLNGRNFEYFSEDPLLTGTMAAAQLHGLHSAGVTGTIKHFCGNNQETARHELDSVISERALREIYLRGFEIAVKQGGARSVMTTYGSVNGLWTAGSYDLCTTILRDEWGFDGFVMTDWWAHINRRGMPQTLNDFAQMVHAQNDVYMVTSDSSRNTVDDNLLTSLADGTLSRGELQRCAANICRFLMNTRAMDRLLGTQVPVEILNRPADESGIDSTNVEFHSLDETLTLPLEDIDTTKGSCYVFALDVKKFGKYRVTLTASSTASHTAQIPVTLFTLGYPAGMFTFNGTDGAEVSIDRFAMLFSRFITCRLYFGQSGLDVKSISFAHEKESTSISMVD